MENGIILFDIDRVIIDTDKLRSLIIENIISLTKSVVRCTTGDVAYGILVTEERMVKSREQFLMSDLIDNLGTYFKSDRLKFELANLLSSPEIFSQSLYPDTRISLDMLSRFFNIGIFSSGDVYFQKMKLRASGLEPYFRPEHITIMERKSQTIPSIVEKYRRFQLALIDNHTPGIEEARQLRGDIIGIWVDRGASKQPASTPTEFSPHYRVNDLQSVPPIFNIT